VGFELAPVFENRFLGLIVELGVCVTTTVLVRLLAPASNVELEPEPSREREFAPAPATDEL